MEIPKKEGLGRGFPSRSSLLIDELYHNYCYAQIISVAASPCQTLFLFSMDYSQITVFVTIGKTIVSRSCLSTVIIYTQ